MYNYHYYKHIHGRDAVIYVMRAEPLSEGYLVHYSWHVLTYDGHPMPPAVPATEKVFTHEEIENWRMYEVPQ